MKTFFFLLISLSFMPGAFAEDCFERYARLKGLDADLLRAIACVESSGNPKAVGKNASSEDLGLMQINSTWVKRFNTSRAELLNDVCRNIEIASEILSDNFSRIQNPWEAVGAYNASCTRLKGQACEEVRKRYAWKVYRAYQSMNDAKREKLGEAAS